MLFIYNKSLCNFFLRFHQKKWFCISGDMLASQDCNVCGSRDLCALPQDKNQQSSYMVGGLVMFLPAGTFEDLKGEKTLLAS